MAANPSFFSKVLSEGFSEAFNQGTLKSAFNYGKETFMPAVKSSGIGTALFGAAGEKGRTGGFVRDFMKFANGSNLGSEHAKWARRIGAYGGAAILGSGAAMGAYSLATRGVSNSADIAQSHPGATALAMGGGVWAMTAGSGFTKKVFKKAQAMAAAGIGMAGRMGKG